MKVFDPTKVDFEKMNGLVPAIVQDDHTAKVLMLAYMSPEALEKTLAENKVTFYSRSRKKLWTKGETSGNFLLLKSIVLDCDQDTILIKASPVGPVCHTGADTCFKEENTSNAAFLHHLQSVIKHQKEHGGKESYTWRMFHEKGLNKIAQKVGEEAVEVVIEAKDNSAELFNNECADLLFHLLMLLEAKETPLSDVMQVLVDRHKERD